MELLLSSNGMELAITNYGSLVLQNFDTAVDVEQYETKGICQDGTSDEGCSLSTRTISIEFILVADSIKQLELLKRKIASIVNPKKEITLSYRNNIERKILVKPVKLPYYSYIGATL